VLVSIREKGRVRLPNLNAFVSDSLERGADDSVGSIGTYDTENETSCVSDPSLEYFCALGSLLSTVLL
jgi:hypothetical protein